MTLGVTPPAAQLLVYALGPRAEFEGQLVGALERIESGGALRIRDALFVGRDRESAELVAVDLQGGRGAGMIASLVGFRLDPDERRRATDRALRPDRDGLSAEVVRELGGALAPGAALLAVLVEHAWARTLEEAVSRVGGTLVANEAVETTTLAALAPELRAAAAHTPTE